MPSALKPEERPLEGLIDVTAIVRRFPGPACVLDHTRNVVLSNSLWDAILTAVGCEPGLPPEFVGSVIATERTGRPQRALTAISAPGGSLNLDVICLPCTMTDQPSVIVFASDLSPIETLHAALVDSRDFHRDLALCSTDATFEIDASGRFTYVGPCGFLGLADFELHGSAIRDLVAERSRHAAEFVFMSREAVWEAELWFCAPDGVERCFLISAMPVASTGDEWAGLRGVAREVTEQRARETEVARAKRSQRNVEAVLHAMRSEADPTVMIRAGAAAVIDTLSIEACVVVSRTDGSPDRIVLHCEANAGETGDGVARVSDRSLLDLCREATSAAIIGPYERQAGGFAALTTATRYAGQTNGALAFLRRVADPDGSGEADGTWSADDRHLLRVTADQIGVALAQVDLCHTTRFNGIWGDDE